MKRITNFRKHTHRRKELQFPATYAHGNNQEFPETHAPKKKLEFVETYAHGKNQEFPETHAPMKKLDFPRIYAHGKNQEFPDYIHQSKKWNFRKHTHMQRLRDRIQGSGPARRRRVTLRLSVVSQNHLNVTRCRLLGRSKAAMCHI